ncbi:type II toxin-antitoxin system HicB family antitoxin [Thalassotalea fusca]
MIYPAKITQENGTNFELSFPDLPGCKTTGSMVEEVMKNAQQAIADHLSILAEYGEPIPHASSIDNYLNNQMTNGCTWALIEFDILPYLGKSHKINVTLPELLIKRIDDRVSKSETYKTRSGFIASACLNELNRKN